MNNLSAWKKWLAYGFLMLFAAACQEASSGEPLPKQSFQFPIGLAIHPQGFALVVSSNFDMAHERGSLRVIDLNQLVDRVLGGQGLDSSHTDLILDEISVGIGNFGSGIALVATEEGGIAAVAVRESNQLVLLDLTILEGKGSEGYPTLELSCWSGRERPANKRFPLCDGIAHVVTLEYIDPVDSAKNMRFEDPFDLLFYSAQPGAENEWILLTTFLRSEYIVAIQIPSRSNIGDNPRIAYRLKTGVSGTNDLARSPATGLIYVTSRYSGPEYNPIHYFNPSLGEKTIVHTVNLFPELLGNETRGVDFLDQDASIATLLVKNPDMLVFLETTPGPNGLPLNDFQGEVVICDNPSRIQTHDNLVFITCAQDDALYVIDARTKRLLEVKEDVCRGPFDMDFFERPDQGLTWLLITCFEDDKVSVLDADPISDTFLKVVAYVGKPS